MPTLGYFKKILSDHWALVSESEDHELEVPINLGSGPGIKLPGTKSIWIALKPFNKGFYLLAKLNSKEVSYMRAETFVQLNTGGFHHIQSSMVKDWLERWLLPYDFCRANPQGLLLPFR